MRYDILPVDTHAEEINRLFSGALTSAGEPGYAGRTILVCFTNRCGSTVACSALSRLGLAGPPNAFKNYEFLNANAVAASTEQHGHPTFEDYLRHCAGQHRGVSGAWTFKAGPQQLNFLIESGLLGRMSDDLTGLWVYRSNLIAQAVSLVTAAHDRRWTSLHPATDAGEPAFDDRAILAAARDIANQNALFELLFDLHGMHATRLRYEDYAGDESVLVSALSRLLGASATAGRPSLLPVARQSHPRKGQWEREVRQRASPIATIRPGDGDGEKRVLALLRRLRR